MIHFYSHLCLLNILVLFFLNAWSQETFLQAFYVRRTDSGWEIVLCPLVPSEQLDAQLSWLCGQPSSAFPRSLLKRRFLNKNHPDPSTRLAASYPFYPVRLLVLVQARCILGCLLSSSGLRRGQPSERQVSLFQSLMRLSVVSGM